MASIFERAYKFVLVWTLSIFFSTFAACGLLFAYIRYAHKMPWKTKDRILMEAPACLTDPKFGKHKYATVNKFRLHYVESGDPSKPLLLFVHGVPEFWWCWRNQIVEFNKDYWVIAVDQRGFNLSDKPVGRHHYKVDNAVADIKELLRHLNRKQCIYVGHDWGAFVGWEFVSQNRNMVYKYAMLGGPSPKVYFNMVLNTFDQFKRSWYFFVFKMPYLPEKLFSAGDYGALFAMWNKTFTDNFTEEDLETLKYVNSKAGALTAQLNYYRANSTFVRESTENLDDGKDGMFILGDKELYVSPIAITRMSNEYPKLRVEVIPGANHFVHQDAPKQTNALLRDFFGSASNYKVETIE